MSQSKLNKNGCTTTHERGQFAYEEFRSALFNYELRVQWDYRDHKGRLHSGIAKSIEEAKAAARKSSGEIID
ncbi:MAG TPA: DUF3873 domain-containing protein [candidate division Zixibacteria bacterium]|nr:DUF3873 domain-containing protein [candidate division Zixibacteria bacterium]